MAAGDRDPSDAVTSRLRMAYQAAALLGERDSSGVVQAWFEGMNPQLDDVAPARGEAAGSLLAAVTVDPSRPDDVARRSRGG